MYFNNKMFIWHASPKVAVSVKSTQHNEYSAASSCSQVALGRLQILSRGLQLLSSKRLHKVGNSSTAAQEAGRQPAQLPFFGPLSGTKPHAFGRAQLYLCEQVNTRLSSV